MKKFIPSLDQIIKGVLITAISLMVLPKLPVVGKYFGGKAA